MKILILSNFGMGLYKFRYELIQELISKGHDVYLSLPNDEYVILLEKIGCKFIESKVDRRGTNIIKDMKLLFFYVNIINKINPDVILSYTIKPNVYGGIACRITQTPYLSTVTGLGTAIENKGILQKITIMLYKIAFKNANCVFFQNQENKDFFIGEGFKINKLRVIPGSGVNTTFFSLLPYPSDNIIHFMFISRIMKEKGIDQYLEAAEFIKAKYPNTRFHVLGFCESNYEEKLNELSERGVIEYHGMQSDVREFHRISHCTIHPTYYPEGMSNVLLESAASGRPIITTNRSGCREIIDDGVNGYVVEQRNSDDLIKKIEMFLALSYEERKKMGLAGRNKVEKEFNRKNVVDQYLEELEII